MKNILKRFGVQDICSRFDSFQKATFRLTAQYSVMIFVLLGIVGIFISVLFMLELGLTIGDGPLVGLFEEDSASHETSEKLVAIMLFVNGAVWFFATVISYFFARTTLRPVEQMYRAQEKFVADAAHELRTPLAVMKLGAETLLKKDRSTNEYHTFVEDVRSEADRLINLSNDLLGMVSDPVLNTHQWQTVDLSDFVAQQAIFMQSYAREKGITLDVAIDDDIYIRGVQSDIGRVITNIIKNAVDYNYERGTVRIALKQKLSVAKLSVTDTGIGIADDDLPHVFERFYKASAARTHTDDSTGGLGLYLVKEIVDRHKGSVIIESTPGKGTTLIVSIPCV